MRAPFAVCLLLLSVGLATEARGQEPYSVLTRDVDITQRLILERELYHSRQRTARIESRRWQGKSPLRPSWQRTLDPNITLRYQQQPTYYYPAAPAATFWGGPSAVRIGLR